MAISRAGPGSPGSLKKTRPIPRLLNQRTGNSHYHWTKKWGAGHPARRALPGVESVGIGEDGQARHGDPAFTGRRRDPFRRLRGTGPHHRAASVGFDRGRKRVTDWPTQSRWKKLLKESDPS